MGTYGQTIGTYGDVGKCLTYGQMEETPAFVGICRRGKGGTFAIHMYSGTSGTFRVWKLGRGSTLQAVHMTICKPRQTIGTYGRTIGTYGQMIGTYGQTIGTYGQMICTYGQIIGTYGQTTGTYGQTMGTYGQTICTGPSPPKQASLSPLAAARSPALCDRTSTALPEGDPFSTLTPSLPPGNSTTASPRDRSFTTSSACQACRRAGHP